MNDAYFDENIIDDDIKKTNKHSVSIPTLIISLITTIVLVVIVLNNWGNIKEVIGLGTDVVESVQFEKLLVGDEVKLSGDIFDDGDLVNYTHVFDSMEYGEIGLKSQNINLNNYEGEVYLEGIVEKIYQGIPVVEIDTIYSVDDIKEDTGPIQEDTGDIVETKYLDSAGLYFDGDFFEKYSFVNNGEDGEIKVKNLNTNEIININYFNCDTSITNQNCDRFNEMFATSSVEKFVDAAGIAYYKQSEVQSWFFSNASLYGYFINDTEDAQVKDLVKYVTLVNRKYIEKNILDNIKTICWKPGSAIKNIANYKLFMKNNQLYLNVNGDDGVNSTLSCELKIDLGVKNMAKLIDLKLIGTGDIKDVVDDLDKDGDSSEKDKDETDVDAFDKIDLVENTSWDSDVEQFPINLEKSLEFTSRRGHTIVFPSSNIAYAGKSLQEDFGQKGVNCFSVMNVVKYSEKDVVDQKGSVKIYECSIKDGFDDSSEKFIYKTIGDKKFVIEIVDPSRVQFANNINIVVK